MYSSMSSLSSLHKSLRESSVVSFCSGIARADDGVRFEIEKGLSAMRSSVAEESIAGRFEINRNSTKTVEFLSLERILYRELELLSPVVAN